MKDDALLREAERCRRLAREAADPAEAAILEAMAELCEARAVAPTEATETAPEAPGPRRF